MPILTVQLEAGEPIPELTDFIEAETPHHIDAIDGHTFLFEFGTDPHIYAKLPDGTILFGTLEDWRQQNRTVWGKYWEFRKMRKQ